MELIEPLLRRGLPAGRRSSPDLGPAKGVPYVPERANALPTLPAPLPEVTRYVSVPDIIVGEAPLGRESLIAVHREGRAGSSAPEISVGEAPLGRESLIAVSRDRVAGSSAPEISLGEAPLGRESLIAVHRERVAGSSAPEISLGEAPLGRETLLAIDAEGKPRPTSSPEAIRVELVSAPELAELSAPAAGRATMPWVEPPEDTKRAADAAKLGRRLSPPKVTIKLEEADPAHVGSSKP